jgi:hypothetical protein
LTNHQNTKTGIVNALTTATTNMKNKEAAIKTKEKTKKDADAAEAKADGDAREAELKSLKTKETTQQTNL